MLDLAGFHHGNKVRITFFVYPLMLLVENIIQHDHHEYDNDPQRQVLVKRVQKALLCKKMRHVQEKSRGYMIITILKE
jgi:hypothetical protein